MDFYFFVDIWPLIIIIILIASIFYGISQAFTFILLTSTMVIAIFYGIIKVIKNIKKAKKYKNWIIGIAGVFQGIMILLTPFYVYILFNIAIGDRETLKTYFNNAKFILWGNFEKLDINLVCILMSMIFIIIYIILWKIICNLAENGNIFLSKIISVSLCFISFIFPFIGWKIALKDEINNTYEFFTWSNHDGEIQERTQIWKSVEGLEFPVGTWEPGTLIYIGDHTQFHLSQDYNDIIIHDEECLWVTDGESVGYVKKSAVKVSVKNYIHQLTEGATVYEFDEYEGKGIFAYNRPKNCSKLDTIKMICDKNLSINVVGETSTPNYFLIELEDGIEGLVEKSYILETKIMK